MAKKVLKNESNAQAVVVAVLSYITVIGWLVAFFLNREKRSDLGSFHLKQGLMILLMSAISALVPVIGWILWVITFVFWVIGLVAAMQKEKKELPVVGKLAQDWFKEL